MEQLIVNHASFSVQKEE